MFFKYFLLLFYFVVDVMGGDHKMPSFEVFCDHLTKGIGQVDLDGCSS